MSEEAHARVLDGGYASIGPAKEDHWALGAWSEYEDASLLDIVPFQADSGYASLPTSPQRTYDFVLQSHDQTSFTDFSGDESRTQERQSQHQDGPSSGSLHDSLAWQGVLGESVLEACKPTDLERQRDCPGGACADCRRKKTKCTHFLTNWPIPEHHSDARTESDSSDNPPSPSPENDTWLTLAYAKHRMMVSLMRDIYAIFNPQWKADLRSRTGSEAASTGASSQNTSSRTPSSTTGDKRRMQNRDSPPPNADDEKKKKVKSTKSGDGSQERLFACFFYKNNPQKYCSNSDTGTKYRSCAGPGYSKISQLKQHLKRTHRGPIHCPRCWLVVESHTEMASHANAEERCEQREPQALEGVDQDKMRLITDTWGVSWEGIYEILFPGAPIPSPYYEAEDLLLESFESTSPPSRELRDFELYNRTTLPILVEANLRAMMESQIAPIEERVRAMVVDIVRTCQSTVARNYHLAMAPTSSANQLTQPSSPAIASIENTVSMYGHPAQISGNGNVASPTVSTYEDSAQISGNGTVGPPLDFFREPPHLNAEASTLFPGSVYNPSSVAGYQNQISDSGYASLRSSCGCSCHDYSNAWNTANGRSSCESCASTHSDPNELDFGNLDTDFGNLDNDFGFLDTDFGFLDTDFGNLDNDFGNLDTDFGNLDNDFGNLDTDFDGWLR